MATQFIVHDKKDTVGVIVVEDVKPGATLEGWLMEGDGTVRLKALKAIPLGHKIALVDMKKGDTVVTAGGLVGKVVSVDDVYANVEIAPTVKVKVVKATIVEVQPLGGKPAND